MMIEVVSADITKEEVDAIVNAANEGLYAGGGVCGAIHAAGGPSIEEECMAIPGVETVGEADESQGSGFLGLSKYTKRCPTGEAKITGAGSLPAKFVIHAVGPVWKGGEAGEEKLLYAAYKNSIKVGAQEGCKTISFPSLSTGIFGYPLAKAAPIAVEALKEALAEYSQVEKVRICTIDQATAEAFEKALASN